MIYIPNKVIETNIVIYSIKLTIFDVLKLDN